MDYAALKNKSCAILFLDVRIAFAAMLRHFILPEEFDGNPADFYVDRLIKVGFSRVEALEILGKASGAMSWYAAGGSEHLLAYLRNLYAGSWASTEGLAGVFSTKTGSMAGTPLGDLILRLLFRKFLGPLGLV